MMKVLLINPPSFHIAKSSVEWDLGIESIGAYPPLGLMQIAAQVLKSTDYQIKIIDTVVSKMDYATLEKDIVDFAPDVVGMTAFTFAFYDLMQTAKLVKKINPNIHICLGGPHTTVFARETVAKPEIDSIVLGEGEFIFIELLKALEEKKDIKTVKGLVIKDKGKVIQTGEPGFTSNLDELPYPAFELVPFKEYYSSVGSANPTGVLCSSRGCPYRCTFCLSPATKYRQRSIEKIIEEIKAYYEHGIREFFFFDDLFNINTRRVEEFSQALLDKGLDITWAFRGRVDQVSENMLCLAKKSGCRLVSLGIEDYTDEGLKLIKKNITVEQIVRAVSLVKKVGIECSTNWIIGFPHHKTKQDIVDMINFVKKLDPDYAEFTILVPFYGTAIYEEGIQRGILSVGVWEEFIANPTKDFLIPAWEEHFSREELSKLYKMCYNKFYFRPKYVIKQITKVKSLSEFFMKAKVALNMVK